MKTDKQESRARLEGAVSPGGAGKVWNCLRNTFESFLKHKMLLLVLFLFFCLFMNGFYYEKSLHTASSTVSLEYEEAAKGQTPSKTRFNIFEIQSAEVMERLIDYAGLRGAIEAEELSKCISVRATHDKKINGKVNFISTSYVIEFTDSDKIRSRTAFWNWT